MDRLVRVCVVGGILAAASWASAAFGAPAGDSAASTFAPEDAWHLCADTAREVEQREKLPETMLQAITTVETGKGAAGEAIVRPWPWTIFAEGRGQHFATKADAIQAVRELRARGVESIDVGCMQVNLHYHPGAFTSLEEAFDPSSNIAYAASLLKSLKNDNRTWESAIEHYHSYDPDRRSTYRMKVFASWQSIGRDRDTFRLASEVSLEHLGTPGGPIASAEQTDEGPITAGRDSRHRAPRPLFGVSVVHLASLDPRGGYEEEAAPPAPIVVIAVDLSPRPSDRPDPTHASLFGRTTVAAADAGAAAPARD